MGRYSLIIILGLAFTVGYLNHSMNASKKKVMENVVGYHRYASSKAIAHSGMNEVLRALDNHDSVFAATGQLNLELLGGRANITRIYPDTSKTDTLDLVSVGKFMDSTFTMKVHIAQGPSAFPDLKAALNLRLSGVDEVEVESPSELSGFNHDINGNLLAPSSNDKAGLAYFPVTKPELEGAIVGSPPSVRDTAMWNPVTNAASLIAVADYNFTGPATVGGPTSTSIQQFGTAASPVIIYANGTAGLVQFQNLNGYGILLARGKTYFRPNFTWHGLVIAYEVNVEEWEIENNARVIGALLISAAKTGLEIELEKGCKIQYSQAAMDMAKRIGKIQAYKTLSWYE